MGGTKPRSPHPYAAPEMWWDHKAEPTPGPRCMILGVSTWTWTSPVKEPYPTLAFTHINPEPPQFFPQSLAIARLTFKPALPQGESKEEVAMKFGCRLGELSLCPAEASTNTGFRQAALAGKNCLCLAFPGLKRASLR